MKFFDKVKDLFSDEEEVVETEEIEVEEKEEHKLPTFMRNKIEEEQKREEARKVREEREEPVPKTNVISDREIVKTRTSNNFAFPIDMDDSDLVPDLRYSKQNVLQKEREREKPIAELYAKKEEPKPKKFRPTPVISPVYGVLDKNYTKDEVKVQDENSYEIQRPSRKVDFETVRNKAFGTLTDDLKNVMCENCELYQEVKITKNADRKPQIDNSNLLASMTEEGPAEDISLGDAEDNYFDFGVSYEPPKKEEPKTVDITDEVKIVDHNEEESKAEKIEVKEKPETRQTIKAKENKQKLEDKDFLEDTKEFESLTHDEEDINEILKSTEDITQTDDSNDIFNLIDSMYDEEEDKK